MLVARAAMEKGKEKKDGDVASGPPKTKGMMTEDDLERFLFYYVREIADANSIPQPPREPPPSHILEARRFASG